MYIHKNRVKRHNTTENLLQIKFKRLREKESQLNVVLKKVKSKKSVSEQLLAPNHLCFVFRNVNTSCRQSTFLHPFPFLSETASYSVTH